VGALSVLAVILGAAAILALLFRSASSGWFFRKAA
jgi:hypothetical protein